MCDKLASFLTLLKGIMAIGADWANRNGEYVSAQWPDARSREAKDPAAAAKLHEQALALLVDYL